MTVPYIKKLKPKPEKFRKVLVSKCDVPGKLKAYTLFVKGPAKRYHIMLPKLPIEVRDNISQVWVIPNSEKKLPQPFTLNHGATAFLESGVHDYSLPTSKRFDYFGNASSGNTLFILILKDT